VATLTTPVVFGDRLLGVLHSHSTQAGKRFTLDDLRRLKMLATQAAIAIENARLFEEARMRSARLAALSELSRRVTSSLEPQQVFDYVVRAGVDLLGLGLARVWVWQEDTGLLHLRASAGDTDLLAPARDSFHSGEGITGVAFQTRAVTTVADAGQDDRYAEQAWALEHGVKAVAVVPLVRGEGAAGVISVGRREDRPFTGEEIDLLLSFAQHAAIAIENARLFERDRELSVVEERNRLARDLHDSVTQTLFSVVLTAEAASTLLERDGAAARAQLDRLQELSRDALREMRSLIFELRPADLAADGLVATLRKHCEVLQRVRKIDIAVDVDGERPLPEDVEQELFRVAQEALNNALKHADAKEIRIGLIMHDNGASLTVRDDGRGFDPRSSRIQSKRLGLTSMRERAEAMGARLTVESSPGAGTLVRLDVPLE
jgi:signal transduction histidine kinase